MFIQVLVTFFFWVVARVTEYNFVLVAYINPKKSVSIKLNNDFCNEVRHENLLTASRYHHAMNH